MHMINRIPEEESVSDAETLAAAEGGILGEYPWLRTLALGPTFGKRKRKGKNEREKEKKKINDKKEKK